MLKLKNFSFSFCLLFLTLPLSSSFQINNSYALDLTIDLPPDAGKAPILYYNPSLQSKTNLKRIDNVQKLDTNDIPPPPSTLLQNNAAIKNNSGNPKNSETDIPDPAQPTQNIVLKEPISKKEKMDKNFPELSCLKDNVDFWEKVYSEVDVNEGLIHDRNNLGRIYAVVSLPSAERARANYLRNAKKNIELRLVNLAKKIKDEEPLSQQDKNLAKLFSKKVLTYKTVMQAASDVRIQTGLKSQFTAGIQRSMNYMPVVFPIVKKSGLPIDLVYLPHVESSYNSRAGSKVGALGLWQLMPSTMRILEGRDAVYRRTDPSLSTKAAMKLLKKNYETTGSWPLALTAYNHGANGIVRAIQETNSRDLCKIIEHYDSPSFKFASSNFYAQFLAARKIAMKRYKVLASTERYAALRQ